MDRNTENIVHFFPMMSPAAMIDRLAYSPVLEKAYEIYQGLEAASQKAHSIWGQVYGAATNVVTSIISVPRSAIGAAVRDAFFFPMKNSVFTWFYREELQKEIAYCRDFWDPTKPLDCNFPQQAEIRERFNLPEDHTLDIQLPNGHLAQITYRVIQTKIRGDAPYRLVHIPGIYASIQTTVSDIYPYLADYLKQANKEAAEAAPPSAQFIIISENNLNYKPASVDEASLILLEILKALKARFGEIDQLVAHSLGTVFFANLLKQVENPSDLPKSTFIDRGPRSIWEASKKLYCGLGRLIWPFVKFGGWNCNLEQAIANFFTRWKDHCLPQFLVAGMARDFRFSGSANLCLGKKIQQIEGVQTLLFTPPHQVVHPHSQHSMRADRLSSLHLTATSDYLQPGETLSHAVVRHSLASRQPQAQAIAS